MLRTITFCSSEYATNHFPMHTPSNFVFWFYGNMWKSLGKFSVCTCYLHLLSISYMPGTVLIVSHILTHLIHTTITLCGMGCYCTDFTDAETGIEMLINFPNSTQSVSGCHTHCLSIQSLL